LARFSARDIECVAQLASRIDSAQIKAITSDRIPHRLAGGTQDGNFEICADHGQTPLQLGARRRQ